MTSHKFKSSYGQCECLWCGNRGRGDECPINAEIRTAVVAYAKREGRSWKSKLRESWMTGNYPHDEDLPYLQQFRNIAGPSILNKISPRTLESWEHHQIRETERRRADTAN